jgi:hypothetical protein
MLRPAAKAGKALCLPQRNRFPSDLRKIRRNPPFTLQ